MMEIMMSPLLDRFGTTSQKIMMETMIRPVRLVRHENNDGYFDTPFYNRFGATGHKITMEIMICSCLIGIRPRASHDGTCDTFRFPIHKAQK